MCRSCENCQYYKEDFEYDDFSEAVWDYCKCVLTNELIDCSEAEHCKDYTE